MIEKIHSIGRMKRWVGWIVLGAILPWNALSPASANSIQVRRTRAAGQTVMVLSVDMNDPNIKVTGMLAENGRGSSESLARMVSRTHPTAAVTGTYFDPASLIPVGDIVIDGRQIHRGGIGTGLCISPYNDLEFVHPRRRYKAVNWHKYDFVCCSGPRLVSHGRAGVYPGSEGFRDPRLLGRATRLAVGKTKDNKLIFVATRNPIYLGQLAKAMKALGCVEAINLDAGSSLGLYHNGKMHMRPGRKLTNAILIYDNADRYEQFKHRLTPAFRLTARK
jgi:hypothetical protein